MLLVAIAFRIKYNYGIKIRKVILMVFNSASFLFLFLPAALILYRLLPGREAKNILLCLLSLLFYAFGGLAQLPVLLAAALWSYGFGLLLAREGGRRKLWLALGAAGNLALLSVFKYLSFVLGVLGLPPLSSALPLPLGISFFTFHAISYLVDTYRDRALAEKRFDRLLLYLAFFPRLIAGPIAKWKDSRAQLTERRESLADTAAGLRRFVRGLLKKLLLAESAAALVNAVYALEPGDVGTGIAWLGGVCYCLQIYYDFSGYSDMAIGLGQLFGFRFPENFDHPYISRSVTEFWRRWHISLNRWFVDYLYIPLGGSRRGKWVTQRNRLIVFLATGIWHGAGWTFLLWGLWNGLLVILEGLFPGAVQTEGKSPIRRILLHLYALMAFLLGFMMFRAGTVQQGLLLIGRLFSFTAASGAGLLAVTSLLSPARCLFLALGLVFAMPVAPRLRQAAAARLGADSPGLELLSDVLALLGLVLGVLAMAGGAYTPFIYQQF